MEWDINEMHPLWKTVEFFPCRIESIKHENGPASNRTMAIAISHGYVMREVQWILPLYMKLINFQSEASVVCSVIKALLIDKLNVFSQNIYKITNEYLNSAKQITKK